MDNLILQSNIESTGLYSFTLEQYIGSSNWYLLPDLSNSNIEYFRTCVYGFANIYRKLTIDRGHVNIYSIVPILIMSEERANELEAQIYKNQIFRWKMKRLIHKWRLSKFKQINVDDIHTGEPPKKLVCLYDWNQRSKYVFEANTIYRDLCERLFTSDGLFINTQYPRNFFTNTPLSIGQLHFIIEDLRKYGFSHWALQGLQSCNYALNYFKRIYKQSIHIEVLKRCFATCTSQECVDLVTDFVELEHEYHDKECIQTAVLLWYIKTYYECPLVQAWRKLCFKYYKYAYMNPDFNYTDTIHMLSREIMKTDHVIMYQKYIEVLGGNL
jgi:hypothetical protein